MPIKIFVCYAPEDESLFEELKKHLSALMRQDFIEVWHHRNISAGTDWQQEVDNHLNTAQIILLLISPDFIASDYSYGFEMKRALERHEKGEARVIPIILRYVYWENAPFGKLPVLPLEGKPIKSAHWYSQDQAFFNVTTGLLSVIDELSKPSPILAYEIKHARSFHTRPALYLFATTHTILPAIQIICKKNRPPINKTDGELLRRIDPIILSKGRMSVVDLPKIAFPSPSFVKLFFEDDSSYGSIKIYHPPLEKLKLT